MEALILGKDGAMANNGRYPAELRERAVRMVLRVLAGTFLRFAGNAL